jgi:hypothetical protein
MDHQMSTDRFWIDHMVEKHECFHCDMRTEKIQVGNESIELLVPIFAVRFEVVETQKSPNRLFLILRDLETSGWDDPLGIVAVALRELSAVNRYRVIFWHATYPYIWKYLQPGISPGKSADEQSQ